MCCALLVMLLLLLLYCYMCSAFFLLFFLAPNPYSIFRCTYNEECSFRASNAHCSKAHDRSECQCLDGFHYSYHDDRCLPGILLFYSSFLCQLCFISKSLHASCDDSLLPYALLVTFFARTTFASID